MKARSIPKVLAPHKQMTTFNMLSAAMQAVLMTYRMGAIGHQRSHQIDIQVKETKRRPQILITMGLNSKLARAN